MLYYHYYYYYYLVSVKVCKPLTINAKREKRAGRRLVFFLFSYTNQPTNQNAIQCLVFFFFLHAPSEREAVPQYYITRQSYKRLYNHPPIKQSPPSTSNGKRGRTAEKQQLRTNPAQWCVLLLLLLLLCPRRRATSRRAPVDRKRRRRRRRRSRSRRKKQKAI